MMATSWLGPEWAISDEETERMARAFAAWRSFHDPVVDPKTAALLLFLGVAGGVEGPRLLATAAKRSMRKASAKAHAAAAANAGISTVIDLEQAQQRR